MSKRKKCLSSHTGGSTADRISNLPDPIIHHILSFLPTVDVVQTCVLSKRWVTLSCSAPSIDLDIDLFTDRKKLHRKKRHAQVRFVEFVDNVLLFHDKSDIHKFRLKLNYDTDTNRDYGWITLVIRKNVQVLDIEIPKRIKQPFELPPSLFRCESLRVLKLRLHSSNLRLPSSLCLSGLRKLVLESVKFYDDQSVESIITSCPVLETLVLLYSGVPSKKNLTISSHQLKNLTVIGYGYIPGGKFKIIAPALTKLKLAFTIPDICVFEEPYSLFDVIIELYERQFSGKVIQFLGGFCNAKSLSLSAQFNEVAVDISSSFSFYFALHYYAIL
ncbi:hypothetical protein GIB67_013161 [Kingdonia uniflora]|uniref:F-box domain-containing protein n=1 Tax=Kingdonia uniflora TaxID=39325 RepID=A0A7J7LCW5_9MAGN|nr:hypothetical protein GIB67_013161 [Kingdonia uniflora]